MVLIPNNASLAIEAKVNSTLIATAGEKGKVYVLKIMSISCTYTHVYSYFSTHFSPCKNYLKWDCGLN